MYQQIPPVVVELLLFSGFKDEAETLFCLCPELSKDFNLCYNMIILTPPGLICRTSLKGDYKTVKDLCEFYSRQSESQNEVDTYVHMCQLYGPYSITDEIGTYAYMTDRLYNSYSIEYEVGPMLSALKNGHVNIYNLLKSYINKHRYHEHTEYSIPHLLVAGMDEGLRDELFPLIEDIIQKDFSEDHIRRITAHLKESYSEWADVCKEQDNYCEKGFVCIAFLNDWQSAMRCTARDRWRIIGKVTPWSDILYTLSIKLNINPSVYMVDIDSYNIEMCPCRCNKLSADQQINDAWCKEIEKSHLDGYERMRLKLVK